MEVQMNNTQSNHDEDYPEPEGDIEIPVEIEAEEEEEESKTTVGEETDSDEGEDEEASPILLNPLTQSEECHLIDKSSGFELYVKSSLYSVEQLLIWTENIRSKFLAEKKERRGYLG